MDLNDLILHSAEKGTKLQKNNGAMPSGSNGSYNHDMTPVRNTSHWLITFLKAYELKENDKFLESSEKCIDYLTSEKARPYGKTFHHRDTNNKNKCNGLIGQAWTIEALKIASEKLNRPELEEIAEDVFLLHSFNEQFGLWKMIEINGDKLTYDRTFNHQLWFAAAGSMLQNKEIQRQVNVFLDNIESNLDLYMSGLIFHKIWKDYTLKDYLSFFTDRDNFLVGRRQYKKSLASIYSSESYKEKWRERSIGYHSFNTYGFGILKENHSDHSFWNSEIFNKILEYTVSDTYKQDIENNKFGFPYNVTGIENAYTLHKFAENSLKDQKYWLKKQLKHTYNLEDNMLSLNTADPETCAARIYEATRLPNYKLEAST